MMLLNIIIAATTLIYDNKSIKNRLNIYENKEHLNISIIKDSNNSHKTNNRLVREISAPFDYKYEIIPLPNINEAEINLEGLFPIEEENDEGQYELKNTRHDSLRIFESLGLHEYDKSLIFEINKLKIDSICNFYSTALEKIILKQLNKTIDFTPKKLFCFRQVIEYENINVTIFNNIDSFDLEFIEDSNNNRICSQENRKKYTQVRLGRSCARFVEIQNIFEREKIFSEMFWEYATENLRSTGKKLTDSYYFRIVITCFDDTKTSKIKEIGSKSCTKTTKTELKHPGENTIARHFFDNEYTCYGKKSIFCYKVNFSISKSLLFALKDEPVINTRLKPRQYSEESLFDLKSGSRNHPIQKYNKWIHSKYYIERLKKYNGFLNDYQKQPFSTRIIPDECMGCDQNIALSECPNYCADFYLNRIASDSQIFYQQSCIWIVFILFVLIRILI